LRGPTLNDETGGRKETYKIGGDQKQKRRRKKVLREEKGCEEATRER